MSNILQQSLAQKERDVQRGKIFSPLQVSRLSSGLIPALLLFLAALAAWLRLRGLGTPDLWLDEAYSVLFAHTPAGQFWKLMWSREGNMLLYYLLLRPWVHLGDTEFMLRLPSVIFAVASIPAIYLLGRDLFGKVAGLVAAALLSVHMFHVFLSRQARSYSLLVLLLLLSCWLLLTFTKAPQRTLHLAAYASVSALAVYAHLFALLVIGSQWLAVLGTRRRRIDGQRFAVAIALFFVLALPMEAFALLKNRGQLDWVPAFTTGTLLDGVHAICGYGSGWLSGLYLMLAIAAVGIGAQTEDEAFALRVVECWLLFPLLLMLVYSVRQPIFYSRFLLMCIPALILLAARGLVVIGRGRCLLAWMSTGVCVIMLGLSLKPTWSYLTRPTCADWRPATQFVVANAHGDDAVCFAGTGAEIFLYYMQREKHMPWSALPSPHYSRGARCLGNSPEAIASAASPYQRAWLLKTDASPQQQQWLSRLLTARFSPALPKASFGCPAAKIAIELLP